MRTRRGIQFCKSATCPHIPEPVRNLSLSLPDCFLGHSCSQYKGNNDPYTCPRTECRNDIIASTTCPDRVRALVDVRLYQQKWLEGQVARPLKSQFKGQGIHTAISLRNLRDASRCWKTPPDYHLNCAIQISLRDTNLHTHRPKYCH